MTQAKHNKEKEILNVELDADLMQFVNNRAIAEGKNPADYIVGLLDSAIRQRKQKAAA